MNTIYLKYLTSYKFKNYLKSRLSYNKSIGKTTNLNPPLPWALSIEPNNTCNLNCIACPVGNNSLSRDTGYMDIQVFKNIISQTKKHLIYLNLYFQGESLLHPQIGKMIEIAHNNNIYTCISTNGQLIKQNIENIVDSGLNKLIISVDGLKEDTYQTYRKGGTLKNITQGIEKLNAYKHTHNKKNPHIEIQFIVMNHNQHEIRNLSKFKKQFKTNSKRLKSVQIYSMNNINLLPDIEKYCRYRIVDSKLIIKGNLRNQCYRMWSSSIITWDGNVLPCCFDKDAKHIMGNLKNNSFKEIWYNKRYYDFRKNIYTFRKGITMCNNCTEGLNIRY